MSTSDGISASDWDQVRQLAVEAVNAHDSEKPACHDLMLRCLDALEQKYGPLPSILATRADYIDGDQAERESLLLSALVLAEQRRDLKNLAMITQSLAELSLEAGELGQTDRWLSRMRGYLSDRSSDEFSEYQRLRAEYRKRILMAPVSSWMGHAR